MSAAIAVCLAQGQRTAGAWLAGSLLLYLFVVRLSLCRVETQRHRPCRWRVRGVLTSCDYHRGRKRTLPRLIATGGLPELMWPRHDLTGWAAASEVQPPQAASGTAVVAPSARGSTKDNLMAWLTVAGVVVAFLALLRDLLAG